MGVFETNLQEHKASNILLEVNKNKKKIACFPGSVIFKICVKYPVTYKQIFA